MSERYRKRYDPGREEGRNAPASDRDVGQYAGEDNGKCDEANQRLIKHTLEQHQRQIAIHSGSEHRHGCRRGNESADQAGEWRSRQLDDSGPNHRRRAYFPGPVGIVCFQIHGQHDRERIRDDGGHVVAVDMRGDIGPLLGLRQARCKNDQTRVSRSEIRSA